MEHLECREGLTKQWLLDQRCGQAALHQQPSPRLLSATSGGRVDEAAAALGTTFPPQAHMLTAFRERLARQMGGRNTCHSEPDLSHGLYGLDNREGDDEDDVDDADDDDDHLFEFDLCDGEEEEDKSGGGDSDDLEKKHRQLNNDNDSNQASADNGFSPSSQLPSGRKFSISSDGSSSSCRQHHRKGALVGGDDQAGPEEQRHSVGGGYIGSLFGSRSSGIGSERRSSQETVSEPEGLSFEPDQWRDYMLDRMSNDGTTTSSSTSLASSASDGGNATPIMAASLLLAADSQPLVSPDSALDPMEDQPQLTTATTSSSCPECEQEQLMAGEEELELIVEIRDNNNDDNRGDNQEEPVTTYVASMGPLLSVSGEDSISDKDSSSEDIDTIKDDIQAAAAAPVIACENNLSEPPAAAAAEPKEAAAAAAVEEEAVVEEEEEVSSESDYAKEEEPEVGADAHLMADIKFSQQKLHELLNQLEKQNRYPATSSSSSNSSTAEQEVEGVNEKKIEQVDESAGDKESSPPPHPASPKEPSPAPPPAEGGDASSSSAKPSVTPERRGSGDQEISDHIDRAKLRKCSSLKSGRTPPGTPGVRKIVRFADIFGLDLQEVKTFTDEIPRIPRRAFQDLDVDLSDYDIGSPRGSTPVFNKFFCPQPQKPQPALTSLVPMFNQPGGASNFFDTVVGKKVSLENAYMEAPTLIAGIVRVLNIDYHKAVTVRWTVNDWATFTDLPAAYVAGSSDGFSDKFSFRLCLGSLPVGSRIQFCLRYNSSGSEFWDSNNGANYVFQVFLTNNSPGGVGGVNFRTTAPLSIAPRSQFTTAHQSPSQHGDDPWLRFM